MLVPGCESLQCWYWFLICRYHRFTIKETLDKFVLTTHSPGEPQDVQEMAHAAFRPALKR